MERYFSDSDITKLLDGKVEIFKYSDLSKMNSINELIGKYGKAVILFEINGPDNGHWTALKYGQKNGENVIFYFDSYGLMPERELRYLPRRLVTMSNQLKGLLYKLFRKQPLRICYNQYRLQKLSSGINTCGRWCVLFLKYNLDEDEFAKVFREESKKYNTTPDELSVYLTS